MLYVTLIQSYDISDSITELTNAIGYFLTFLLVIGFGFYQLIRWYAREDQKKSSLTSIPSNKINQREENKSKTKESEPLSKVLLSHNYSIITKVDPEFGINYRDFLVMIRDIDEDSYFITITYCEPDFERYDPETKSRFVRIGKNIGITESLFETYNEFFFKDFELVEKIHYQKNGEFKYNTLRLPKKSLKELLGNLKGVFQMDLRNKVPLGKKIYWQVRERMK